MLNATKPPDDGNNEVYDSVQPSTSVQDDCDPHTNAEIDAGTGNRGWRQGRERPGTRAASHGETLATGPVAIKPFTAARPVDVRSSTVSITWIRARAANLPSVTVHVELAASLGQAPGCHSLTSCPNDHSEPVHYPTRRGRQVVDGVLRQHGLNTPAHAAVRARRTLGMSGATDAWRLMWPSWVLGWTVRGGHQRSAGGA
jgi:hypothetical protein